MKPLLQDELGNQRDIFSFANFSRWKSVSSDPYIGVTI